MMETSYPENSDGSPESVFEGLHIAEKFLKMYVEDMARLHPDQKKKIEQHVSGICPKGECQKRIDNLVRNMHEDDPKMSQLPEGDR